MKSGLLVVLIVLFVIGPFLGIWALNTLFILSIPYTFKTWLAMVIVGAYFASGKNTTK